MADAYKLLAQGQLPSSVGTLYTAPAGTGVIIRNITVVNNDSSDRTFRLTRSGTAAANYITPPSMVVKAGGACEWDGAMTLSPSEVLSGVGSVASQLTYTISGDETS